MVVGVKVLNSCITAEDVGGDPAAPCLVAERGTWAARDV